MNTAGGEATCQGPRAGGGYTPGPDRRGLECQSRVCISCCRGGGAPQKDAVEGCITGLSALSWELSL